MCILDAMHPAGYNLVQPSENAGQIDAARKKISAAMKSRHVYWLQSSKMKYETLHAARSQAFAQKRKQKAKSMTTHEKTRMEATTKNSMQSNERHVDAIEVLRRTMPFATRKGYFDLKRGGLLPQAVVDFLRDDLAERKEAAEKARQEKMKRVEEAMLQALQQLDPKATSETLRKMRGRTALPPSVRHAGELARGRC